MTMISQSDLPLNNIAVRVPDDYHDSVNYENIRSHIDFKNLYMIAPYSAGDVLEPVYRTENYRPYSVMYDPKWFYNPNYNHKIDVVSNAFKSKFGRKPNKDETPILIPDPIDYNINYFRLVVLTKSEVGMWSLHHPKNGEVYLYDSMSIYSLYCLVFGEDGVHGNLISKGDLGYEQFDKRSYEGFTQLCRFINS